MARRTGTMTIGDLLAATDTTVNQQGYDQDTIAQVLAEDNANYNAMVQDALSDICAITDDRLRRAGTSVDAEMQEADELSRIPTQKATAGYPIGFPMKQFQFALGWTRQWERQRSVADFAIAQQAAQAADLRRLRYELMTALFNPTNYTFVDKLVDQMELPVKALINADSSAIQNGPFGQTFDGSTHTHFNTSATLTAAAVQAAIDDVVEHGFGGQVRVNINQANEAAFRQLSGFVGYVDPRLTLKSDENEATQRAVMTRMDNRPIGVFGAAEVWVKPWVPANYLVCYDVGTPLKPLVMRIPKAGGGNIGFGFEAEIETFPLRAQYMERNVGFGAWNRLNGCVLQFNNETYSAPTFTY